MSDTDDRRLVPVSVQGVRLLIDAAQVVGVEQGERVQRNPCAGSPFGWLLGSSDGSEVFDLARILDLGDGPRSGAGSVLVLSRMNGELWGLLVDRTEDSMSVLRGEVFDLPKVTGADLYSAVVQVADSPMLLLATESLHPEDAKPHENQVGHDEDSARSVRRESRGTAPVETVNPSQRMLWICMDSEHGLYVGLSAKQVLEIRDPLPIAPIPGAKPVLAGIALHDHQALPIADLGRLLDVNVPPDSSERLLIVRCTRSGRRVGLPIPGEVRLVELPIAHQAKVIEPDWLSWVRGSFQVEENTVIVPDLDAFLE